MLASPVISSSILELIGKTPLVQLSRIAEPGAATVLAKLEHLNPAGSHKDRIAIRMIESAEATGLLRPGNTVVATSCGSFAVALALVCRVRGYRLVAVLPDTVTTEHKEILTAYGASLELTPAAEGIGRALTKAAEIATSPGVVWLDQYDDAQNWRTHASGEGAELVAQAREYAAAIDAVVMTLGTGGTLRGIEEAVRPHFPEALLVEITIQEEGWPDLALRRSDSASFFIGDRRLEISATAAWRMRERLGREEGLLVGMTSGANVEGAMRIARELGPDKFVYTLCCDSGERYFSLEGSMG